MHFVQEFRALSSNRYFDFYTGFNVDGCDLLDDFGRRVQINDTLVDPHLEAIPSFGTFTARCFTGGDAEYLRRHAYWPLDF